MTSANAGAVQLRDAFPSLAKMDVCREKVMRTILRLITTAATFFAAEACLAQGSLYEGSWAGAFQSTQASLGCSFSGLGCYYPSSRLCTEQRPWSGTVDAYGSFTMSTGIGMGDWCGPSLASFPPGGVAHVGQIPANGSLQVPSHTPGEFSCNPYSFEFSSGKVSASYHCERGGMTYREGPCTVTCASIWANATYTGTLASAPGPLSGLWYSPAESGWGIAFTQRRNVVFAAWFTYDANGNPKWYVASNCAMAAAGATNGTCNGTLHEVSGPTFFGTAFNPAAANVVAAGALRVSFRDGDNALMTYTVGENTRSVEIIRQPISTGAMPGVDHTDLWSDPSEPGWGLTVAQQASVMFLAWYVFDPSGRPMWYVSPNCAVRLVIGTSCTGTLYRTKGPGFGPVFDSTKVQAFEVGTVTLIFSDPNNAMLQFGLDGGFGTATITRQLF